MKRGFSSAFRLGLLCTVVLGCFGGIGYRLVDLQVVQADRLVSEVERARKRVQVINARRGDIRDRHGNILATNRPFIQVGVDPQAVRPEDASLIPELARLLEVPAAEIEEAFARKTVVSAGGREAREIRWKLLAESVDEEFCGGV